MKTTLNDSSTQNKITNTSNQNTLTDDFNEAINSRAALKNHPVDNAPSKISNVRANAGKNTIDSDKIINDTVGWYVNRYGIANDAEAVRKFTKEKIDQFKTTASWDKIKDHPNAEKFLGMYAELCVSYKTERNPGDTQHKDMPTSPYFTDFTESTKEARAHLAQSLEWIANGTIEIAMRAPKIEDFPDDGKGCKFNGDKADMEKLLNSGFVGATAVPKANGEAGGTIFIPDGYKYDEIGLTTAESLLGHELEHLVDLHKRPMIDCISTIRSEYNSYKWQQLYAFGEKARFAAMVTGETMKQYFMNEFIEDDNGEKYPSPYYYEYNNLTSSQKKEFGVMVEQMSQGLLISTEAFEKRLRDAEEKPVKKE